MRSSGERGEEAGRERWERGGPGGQGCREGYF